MATIGRRVRQLAGLYGLVATAACASSVGGGGASSESTWRPADVELGASDQTKQAVGAWTTPIGGTVQGLNGIARAPITGPAKAPRSAALPASPVQSFAVKNGLLRATIPNAPGAHAAEVRLPTRANQAFSVRDPKSGMSVQATLVGTSDVAAQIADGYVVYPHAHSSGADVIHRVTTSGTEDYVAFQTQPETASLSYVVDVSSSFGLRFVSNTLELLDRGGAPRIRVAAPYYVDASGQRHWATMSVSGCSYDTNASPPWWREIGSPNSGSCVVTVSWDAPASAYPILVDPAWQSTADLANSRMFHFAVSTSAGRVLVGGNNVNDTSAELYDPTSGSWAMVAPMSITRQQALAVRLPSGKLLVATGYDPVSQTFLQSTEIYDSVAGTWSAGPDLPEGRIGATIVTLADGRALITGGLSAMFGNGIATSLIYDESLNTFAPAGDTVTSRIYPATTLLNDGRVLLVGGFDTNTYATLDAAEIWDPSSSTWTATAPMISARELPTATTLSDGRVLVAGGMDSNDNASSSTELFDPSSGTWSGFDTMGDGRLWHTATAIGGGVLLAGGIAYPNGPVASTDIASAEGITADVDLASATYGQAAASLPDGTALVAGGDDGTSASRAARVYGLSCSNATISLSPSSATSGTAIAVSASATCTGTAEYRFWYDGPNGWTLLQDWGAGAATLDTTGMPVGSYKVQMDVRNQGTTCGYDETTSTTLTITQ